MGKTPVRFLLLGARSFFRFDLVKRLAVETITNSAGSIMAGQLFGAGAKTFVETVRHGLQNASRAERLACNLMRTPGVASKITAS